MITVEGTKKKKKGTPELNKQEVAIFRLIGIAIADQPKKVQSLLAKYGINVPQKPKGSELTEAVIYAISQNDKSFNKQLAELLINQVVSDGYDSFSPKEFSGAADKPNVVVGADPVSAISGAIGSIFSLAGSFANRKAQKKQARRESMMSLMMMNNQQGQNANQQNQANNSGGNRGGNSNKLNIIKMVGTIGLVALVGGIIFWQMRKNKAIAQPEPQLQPQTS